MYSPDPRALPFRSILAEQFRVTGFALLREGALAGAALTLICTISLFAAWRYDERLFLEPELLLPPLFVAALLPFAVWKGDRPFDRAILWTLPVHRQQSAIAKVLAGAAWLMLAMLVIFAALALVALGSGGGVGEQEVRIVEGVGGALTRHDWRTPAWIWLVPFVAALIIYVIGSAAVLGLRYPVRWIAGLGVGAGLLLSAANNLGPPGGFERTVAQLWEWSVNGPIGIDFLLSGGEDSLSYWRPGTGQRYVRIWTALPAIGGWAVAAAAWFAFALALFGLAIRRHWER